MRWIFQLGLVGLLVVASPLSYRSSAEWTGIGGGGGTSSGGGITVQGTIGQAGVHRASGGSVTVTGGFWSVIGVIQTPGAPVLSIKATAGGIAVSWPSEASDWVLEATANPAGGEAAWTSIPPPYATEGTRSGYSESMPFGRKFFRLRQSSP